MSTFPIRYLGGNRPIKRERVPKDVITDLNESMCYIIDSFYSPNYNGKHVIFRYDDFKLTDLYIWDGNIFVNNKK